MIDQLRSAVWQLYQNAKSTLTCVISLAIGIAIISSTASIVDNALLRPLPFFEADRLVLIRAENVSESQFDRQISLIDFSDWEQESQCLEMAVMMLSRLDLPHRGGYQRLLGLYVSPTFLDVMRVRPYLGQDFGDFEATDNWKQIMLSPRVWRERYGSDPVVVGNIIDVNSWASYPNAGSLSFQLSGLLPDGMRCIPSSSEFVDDRGVGPDRELDFLLPINMGRGNYQYRGFRDVDAVGRLRPGVSLAKAQAEMDLICGRLARLHPESNEGWSVRLIPLQEYVAKDIRPFVLATLLAAGLVYVIAIANLVHMMLVQFQQRQSEMAIRAAVGATPFSLLGQVATEFSIVLTIGVSLGLWLAKFCTPTLLSMAPAKLRWVPTTVSLNAVLFAISLAVVSAAAVWWLALRSVVSPDLAPLMGASGRTTTADATAVRTLGRMTQTQLLATYVLLLGAGLLWLRMRQLGQVNPGFDPRNRITMSLSLPAAKYEWDHNSFFNQTVAQRLRDVPGVTDAAVILGLPMGRSRIRAELGIEGRPTIRPGDLPPAYVRVITDTYFETMGIPLVAGRTFNASDSIGEVGWNRTAIVSQTMVERCWPNIDPIGRRFKPYPGVSWMEVIGVVGDVHSGGIDRGPAIDIYYPEKLYPQSNPTLIVHTEASPMSMVGRIRDTILSVDQDASMLDVKTMQAVITESQAERHFALKLLTTLSCIGMVLAVFGIAATTSHSISRRSSELMVRVACGATPLDILVMVLREQLLLVAIAVGVGVVLAITIGPSLNLPWKDMQLYRQLALTVVPSILILTALTSSLVIASKTAFAKASGN